MIFFIFLPSKSHTEKDIMRLLSVNKLYAMLFMHKWYLNCHMVFMP